MEDEKKAARTCLSINGLGWCRHPDLEALSSPDSRLVGGPATLHEGVRQIRRSCAEMRNSLCVMVNPLRFSLSPEIDLNSCFDCKALLGRGVRKSEISSDL